MMMISSSYFSLSFLLSCGFVANPSKTKVFIVDRLGVINLVMNLLLSVAVSAVELPASKDRPSSGEGGTTKRRVMPPPLR